MSRKLTALVIGNSNYPNGASLKNPANDAEDLSVALRNLGFTVITKLNATNEEIDRSIESFRDNLNSNNVGLFYFAGHGIQIKGENYINSIDTNFSDEISAKYTSYPLNQVIDVMSTCSNQTNIIILDACRNNPFVRGWQRSAEQAGLAPVYTPKGTLIAFATSPGETAADGCGKNGRYTEALLRHLNTPDIPIEDLFKRVRNTLSLSTSGQQTSWEHTSLSGDFFFNLSTRKSITIYSSEALSDSLFPLKPSTTIRDKISSLKILNWYTQNPAIDGLTAVEINASSNDELFVLGRNVYQAACGGANSCSAFINNFRNAVSGATPQKIKCILDGMLFEIFFNSKGELRKEFKTSKFNALFDLMKFSDLQQSFEFISEALVPHQSRFYTLPGKSRQINIDIQSEKNEEGEHTIKAICFEGFNILRKVDSSAYSWGIQDSHHPIKLEKLRKTLSTEMLIPADHISITSEFSEEPLAKVLFPYGHTIGK